MNVAGTFGVIPAAALKSEKQLERNHLPPQYEIECQFHERHGNSCISGNGIADF